MPKLINKDTGKTIGTVSDRDIQFLIDQLEEEELGDTDYFICADTVRLLDDNGASDELLEILKATLVEMYGDEILDLPEDELDEEEEVGELDEDDQGVVELEDEEIDAEDPLGFELTWK